MTATEYRAALSTLGLSQLAAGRWLGVSPKTAQRYATVGPSGSAARAVTERIERERAYSFIGAIGQELHHRRIADWYPEAAHNAADQMSDDMRLLGNACADYVYADLIAALDLPRQHGESL